MYRPGDLRAVVGQRALHTALVLPSSVLTDDEDMPSKDVLDLQKCTSAESAKYLTS